VVDIITQYRLGIIQELSCFFLALAAIDDFLQEIGIVASCGFD